METFGVYDDTTSSFVYDDNGWFHISDNSGYAWDNTLSYTSNVSNVTINFFGSWMQLYGTVGQTSQFGRPSVRAWVDDQLLGASTLPYANATTYGVLFVYPENLSDGNHKLVLENSVSGRTLFLDYFQGPLPPSSVSNMATVTKTVSSTDPALSSGGSGTTGASSSSPAAIVGGVMGGIALLATIALAVFFYKRGKRKDYHYRSVTATDLLDKETRAPGLPPSSILTPFPPPETAQSEQRNNDNRSRHTYPPTSVPRSPPVVAPSAVASSTDRSGSSVRPLPSGKTAVQDPQSAYGRQHRDSGIRFGEAGPSTLPPPEEVDVPPVYSER